MANTIITIAMGSAAMFWTQRFASSIFAGLVLISAMPSGSYLGLGKPTHSSKRAGDHHLLYVAVPGIRNYLEFGGIGVLVFDRDNGYKFVKRIPTWPLETGKEAENVKGICASAKTGMLYVSTIKRVMCVSLKTEKVLWEEEYAGGCDRMALSPDGKQLYVPSLEGPHWLVVNALTGDIHAKVEPNSGAHNTIAGADGKVAYLAGLKSPFLNVLDAKAMALLKPVGPFGNVIRPFTVDGKQERCYVNVNDLLGFEAGDLKTGKFLYRVEVTGFQKGPTKRHGCPSHGIALSPDEKELWLCDAFNERLHVFNLRQSPPKQIASIHMREQPGWITFTIDGKHALPSTGEVIDPQSKKIVAMLTDETGRPVHSEKMMEIVFRDGEAVAAGDQFGVGRKK